MFGILKNRKPSRKTAETKSLSMRALAGRALLEPLEARKLLSAAISGAHTTYVTVPAQSSAPASSTNSGYVPSQITSAYGWNKATFGHGNASVPANGAGQTIALIDAASDPNIVSDLETFDAAYGIQDPPSFQVVSQRGLTTDVPTDDPLGWDTEISLDVEWSHAMAPGANILLVECDSQAPTDLMAGVLYARTVPSVSAVSMSFGFPEGTGPTDAEELAYDADFTTPAGHQGITFIASAGDSGAATGILWPAQSPNVLSVGGTSLSIDRYGNYQGESTWGNSLLAPTNGSQPGISGFEPEPAYQDAVQQTNFRVVSDVSYNADPQTGFAIYDSLSVADGNTDNVGWEEIGGTSAGAPQWASLIAVANQQRALQGMDTLDGPSQTMPLLYSVYRTPLTQAYSSYASYFNDVNVGGQTDEVYSNGGVGYGLTSSSIGWDPVTGLGTPKVPQIVTLLDTPTPTIPTGTAGNGVTPANVVWAGNQSLSPSPLSARISTTLPGGVLNGQAGTIQLVLTNSSGHAFGGPVSITLDVSNNGINDSQIATYSFPSIALKARRSVSEKLKFNYPATLVGTYYLIAFVTTGEAETSSATAVSSTSLFIGPPTVDLSVAFASTSPVSITPGRTQSTIVTITNNGNEVASGTLNLALYASADAVLDSSDKQLTSISGRRIRIAPHKSIRIRLVFQSPANLLGGTFDLISSISSSTSLADTITTDKTASIATIAG